MSTKKIQILDSLVAPSDWNATEGSKQILNKPTKLSQFEGEMTTDERVAVREKIGLVQPNYEQNDDTQSDYIKNRTHYKEVIHQEKVDFLPATEIDFASLGDMGYTQPEPLNIQAGDTVKVLWDNQEYECVAQSFATLDPDGETGMPSDGIAFGNLYDFFGVDLDSQGIPFLVVANYAPGGEEGVISGCWMMSTSELANPIAVNIFTGGDKIVYHKLDLNYLPLSNSNISEDDNAIVTSKPLINYLNDRRPNWEINDSDDPKYIKNRPFFRSLWGSTGCLFSTTITLDENGLYNSSNKLFSFDDIWYNSYGDINLTVYWHDGTYNCTLRSIYKNWVDEYGDNHSDSYFVFGNVSDINYDFSSDSAPFLIYADYNPETNTPGETYIKAYDGFTGELTLQVDAEYRYWGYHTLDNKYLDISSLQANWDEENSSAPSYVVNKPFYKQKMSGNSLGSFNEYLEFNDSGVCVTQNSYFNLNEYFHKQEPVNRDNIFIKCIWNGSEYKHKVRYLTCEYYDSDKGSNIVDYYYAFGNVSSINSNYSDTAPFLVYANYNPETHKHGETYIVSQDVSIGTIPLEAHWIYDYWFYNPIDNRYLNLSTNVSQDDNNPVTGDAVYNAIRSSSGDSTFYITVTKDSEEKYTADKTFAEALAAYNEGKILFMIYNGYILPLVDNTNSVLLRFGCVIYISSSSDGTMAVSYYLSIYIYEGGVGVYSESSNIFIDDKQKGKAEGVATLDKNVKIPVAQIPDEIARIEDVNTAIQSAIGNALGGSY